MPVSRRAWSTSLALATFGLPTSEALAAAPEEERATAAAKFAEGAALKAQGKFDEALVAYRAAVAKDPEMSAAWFAVAYAEGKRSGKHTEASIDAYEHCIKLNPKHVSALNNLGWALHDLRKDFDRAEAMYRKAIELDPKDASAHYNLGNLLTNVRKDFDQAEAMYRKAIELDPKDADAHWDLSLLRERGDEADVRLEELLARRKKRARPAFK